MNGKIIILFILSIAYVNCADVVPLSNQSLESKVNQLQDIYRKLIEEKNTCNKQYRDLQYELGNAGGDSMFDASSEDEEENDFKALFSDMKIELERLKHEEQSNEGNELFELVSEFVNITEAFFKQSFGTCLFNQLQLNELKNEYDEKFRKLDVDTSEVKTLTETIQHNLTQANLRISNILADIKANEEQLKTNLNDEIDRKLQQGFGNEYKNSLKNEIKSSLKIALKNELEEELKTKLKSDLQLEITSSLRSEINNEFKQIIKNEIRDEIRENLRSELKNELEVQIRNQVQNEFKQTLMTEIENEFEMKIRNQLQNEFKEKLKIEVENELNAKFQNEMRNEITLQFRNMFESQYKSNLQQEIINVLQAQLRSDIDNTLKQKLEENIRSDSNFMVKVRNIIETEVKESFKHEIQTEINTDIQLPEGFENRLKDKLKRELTAQFRFDLKEEFIKKVLTEINLQSGKRTNQNKANILNDLLNAFSPLFINNVKTEIDALESGHQRSRQNISNNLKQLLKSVLGINFNGCQFDVCQLKLQIDKLNNDFSNMHSSIYNSVTRVNQILSALSNRMSTVEEKTSHLNNQLLYGLSTNVQWQSSAGIHNENTGRDVQRHVLVARPTFVTQSQTQPINQAAQGNLKWHQNQFYKRINV